VPRSDWFGFTKGLCPKSCLCAGTKLISCKGLESGWGTALFTLQIMGLLQILLGLWLIIGWRERAAVSLTTLWVGVLIVLVAAGNPGMLTDPYGALIKDLCLIACAVAVWILAPMREVVPVGRAFES
jgi:hypothetical protein